VTVTGTIGDGLYGSAGAGTGDFDFFRIPTAIGQTMRVNALTLDPQSLSTPSWPSTTGEGMSSPSTTTSQRASS